MKARIIIANHNYVYEARGSRLVLELVPPEFRKDKPWRFYANGKMHRFHTHAKAIKYADKLARKGRK